MYFDKPKHRKVLKKATRDRHLEASEELNDEIQEHSYFKILDCGSETLNRMITVIGGVPFYQSSGENSSQRGTWFPFMGFSPQNMPGYAHIGSLIKPSARGFVPDTAFPKEILDRLKKIDTSNELASRFSNFDCMCVSMFIGGGFWASKEGNKLEKHIKKSKEYRNFLKELKQHHKSQIEFVQTVLDTKDLDLMTATCKTKAEADNFNSWLEKAGSLATYFTFGSGENKTSIPSISGFGKPEVYSRHAESIAEAAKEKHSHHKKHHNREHRHHSSKSRR